MATKLPSGSYRTSVFIGYDDKHKRRYKSFTAETAKKADLLALQWQSAHPSDTLSGLTVKKALAAYIRQKEAVLSPSSIRGYKSIQKMLKADYDGIDNKRLEDLTRDDLQTFVNDLSCQKSPKTVRNYIYLLSAVWNYNNVPFPRVTLPSRVRPQFNIPDEETLKQVFEAFKGTDMEIPVLLGTIGPMRRGEIVAASIDDLDGNVLHVHRSAVQDASGKQIIKDYPKTDGSNRMILLPQSVVDKIRQQGYICNLNLMQVSHYFSRTLARAGIEHFRFHDLRHAFVSIAHAAGLPDAYIQERGGWSTNYTMNNVYRHTLDSDRKKEQEKVNGVFDTLLL